MLAEHNPFGLWQSVVIRFTRTPSWLFHALQRNAPLRSRDALVTRRAAAAAGGGARRVGRRAGPPRRHDRGPSPAAPEQRGHRLGGCRRAARAAGSPPRRRPRARAPARGAVEHHHGHVEGAQLAAGHRPARQPGVVGEERRSRGGASRRLRRPRRLRHRRAPRPGPALAQRLSSCGPLGRERLGASARTRTAAGRRHRAAHEHPLAADQVERHQRADSVAAHDRRRAPSPLSTAAASSACSWTVVPRRARARRSRRNRGGRRRSRVPGTPRPASGRPPIPCTSSTAGPSPRSS